MVEVSFDFAFCNWQVIVSGPLVRGGQGEKDAGTAWKGKFGQKKDEAKSAW